MIEGHLPAEAREVADVTGAGDTVIAVLALALAAGASVMDAARLANVAAGLVVARFGPATVRPEELAQALAAQHDDAACSLGAKPRSGRRASRWPPGLLIATGFTSDDPDSALYAALSARLAEGPSARGSPRNGGATGTVRDCFVNTRLGVFLVPTLLGALGVPGVQASLYRRHRRSGRGTVSSSRTSCGRHLTRRRPRGRSCSCS